MYTIEGGKKSELSQCLSIIALGAFVYAISQATNPDAYRWNTAMTIGVSLTAASIMLDIKNDGNEKRKQSPTT